MSENLVKEVLEFWEPLMKRKSIVEKNPNWKPCLFLDLESREMRAFWMKTTGFQFRPVIKILHIKISLEIFVLSKLYWRARSLSKFIWEAHIGDGQLTVEGDRRFSELKSFVEGRAEL